MPVGAAALAPLLDTFCVAAPDCAVQEHRLQVTSPSAKSGRSEAVAMARFRSVSGETTRFPGRSTLDARDAESSLGSVQMSHTLNSSIWTQTRG